MRAAKWLLVGVGVALTLTVAGYAVTLTALWVLFNLIYSGG